MNIYIGSLPMDTTEDDIRQAFEAYGQVETTKIIKDRDTGKPRGFAFVEMPAKAEAIAAIEGLNGSSFKGSTITVNEARARTNRPAGRGGPGGRGGGRSGFSRGGGGNKRSW